MNEIGDKITDEQDLGVCFECHRSVLLHCDRLRVIISMPYVVPFGSLKLGFLSRHIPCPLSRGGEQVSS